MIKILLADDETDSRDAIVQYIDWEMIVILIFANNPICPIYKKTIFC